jgi:transcription initiation factor TFIIIB Brf1 subunit/transcription initiation factor TFIIB
MDEIMGEIDNQIKEMHLATPAHNGLTKATLDIFNQMAQEDVIQFASISHRIATAAFLACDGNACIAIPKLKRVFGSQIKGGYISNSREVLQIPRGTAPKKLDSLCKVLDVSDSNIIKLAHFYAGVLDGTSHAPSYIAVASLYIACNVLYNKSKRFTLKELYHYTGCGEVTLRATYKLICKKVGERELQQQHKVLLKSTRSLYLLGDIK